MFIYFKYEGKRTRINGLNLFQHYTHFLDLAVLSEYLRDQQSLLVH